MQTTLPGRKPSIFKNLGSIIDQVFDKDQQRRIRDLEKDLADNTAALEFVQSAGWRVIADRYMEYVRGLQDRQLDLCKHASLNSHEIEQISDQIQNAKMLLQIATDVIGQHEKSYTEYQKLKKQGTAQTGTPQP